MTDFPPDLFAGTAEYYERFRPRYPDAMLDDLRAHVGVGGTLVDLACGTGQVAVPMARHFDSVLAVDLEREMIEVGRTVAERAGITNIRWQVGKAEDLTIDLGTVDLVTIASAFHRLDRELIAAQGKRWLRTGGSLVVLGYGDPPNRPTPKAPWQEAMNRVVRKWTGPPTEATTRAMTALVEQSHEELLRTSGYETERHEYAVPRRWTLDELVGLTFSISVSSKRRLGDRADAFENELRAELRAQNPTGSYDEQIRFFAIIARPDS